MTDDDNVIRFPAWRRQVDGAPGVPEDAPTGSSARRPGVDRAYAAWTMPARPSDGTVDGSADGSGERPPRVGAFDRPVWHEGDSAARDSMVTLRIDVLGLRPPVWRRVFCRGSFTLDRVHPLLAAAFGWPREAEYRFRDVVRHRRSVRVGTTFRNPWTERLAPDSPGEWTVPLLAVLGAEDDRMRYGYGRDFGWECTIVAESILPVPPPSVIDLPLAGCLSGRRASPPAAFGTAAMYRLALESDRDDALWGGAPDMSLPPGFDPESVDIDAVDARVRAALDPPVRDDPGD